MSAALFHCGKSCGKSSLMYVVAAINSGTCGRRLTALKATNYFKAATVFFWSAFCCWYSVVHRPLSSQALCSACSCCGYGVMTYTLKLSTLWQSAAGTANVCGPLLTMLPLPFRINYVYHTIRQALKLSTLLPTSMSSVSHHPSSSQAIYFLVPGKQRQWHRKFVCCNCSVRFLRRNFF